MIRTTLLVGGSLLVALGYPLSVLADEAPTTVTDSPTTSVPADETTSENSEQTTSSESASDATSELEEPAATSTPAAPAPTKPKPTYSYDASTGRWNSTDWTYSPITGTYEKTVTPVTAPATVSPAKETDDTSSLGIDSETTSAIANTLSASASTGDASVFSNTTGGSATTGNASSVATIVNNVNSSMANSSNKQAAQFSSDILGDVNGDIMLQPLLLKAMLEAAAAQTPSNTSIQSTNTTGLTNDISLTAQSGDATVAKNTFAGNATSGNANTVANVLNVVNSMIAANQSFVGTINIYGNLNGDILIAPDFLAKLLASNGDTASTTKTMDATVVDSDSTTEIVNNIALAAKTGEALVLGNTSAGNATSGNADTNTVIFNLTNHDIVASNSLLVFVNVLGKWVGVIVDAPVGATAAALGNNVSQNTVTPNLVINAVETTAVTNNINLSSASGNAVVAQNTTGGNALTGNATASANVANILGSSIGLSGWFGVLYINVFGSWLGSFGVDTEAGTVTAAAPIAGVGGGGTALPQVVQFVPRVTPTYQAAVVTPTTVGTLAVEGSSSTDQDEGAVLAAATTNIPPVISAAEPVTGAGINLSLLAGSLILAAASLYGLYRLAFGRFTLPRSSV